MAVPGTDTPPLAYHEDDSRDSLSDSVDADLVGETTPPLPRGRRGARALAVQALYESDITGHPAKSAVSRLAAEADLDGQLSEFAKSLVERAEAGRRTLDARIGEAATDFPADQLSTVDRAVLRVALVETEINPETPVAVIVNEAVELARLFGSDSSGRFVNGVLGALLG